ncbi:GTP pyrophosphokinase [Suicoccus acidiformans]|uniref:GTP diphosphokinase n=1 Tax=Suicoccus acidiformans TaxID=2036206 RepID=A0A347WLH6_9LACT|nr:bifunctional (p)ppGpp synthetase/guanosine-3',5'-bis(diphosphate) 3'-pyrophosphohydrolase [Suicoccus acidiformans]AXY25933.1 GTP pyrophosphokinase [Suicoccus acidiformans]
MTQNIDYTAQEVLDLCATYMNETGVAKVEKALNVATQAHEGQMRMSGEPYIIHPIQVAGILAELKMDPDTVATGFLHDVVEDTDYTLEDIESAFSETIAFLVDGVTKLGKFRFQSKQEALAENHRKMLMAMAKDIRVIIVKLADRLHNMRTMRFQKPEKQVEKSEEALEIYAPLADRIGMSNIKWELEDISLRYINPDAYYNIVNQMDSKREEREAYIQATAEEIQASLQELDIEAEVYGRPKHIYSIYRKMTDQKKEFDDIYDLLALRVITESIKDCYAVVGAVHTKWRPMPGRFKDYIAMPKANMYQSLHTTVIGSDGRPVEIQIRTKEMHEVAENGIAAHWAYKQGKTDGVNPDDNLQKQLQWFRDLVELQDETEDAKEFMDSVKQDLFKDQVYIFTPQGDVIELPVGSGPIDFAYHIHTEVGNKTVGAKVNGEIVSLDYQLKNGDIVQILTNPNSNGPSRDWLKHTHTSKARNRIKRYFKHLEREEKAAQGEQIMDRELREAGRSLKFIERRKVEDALKERFNFNEMTDFYAAIGYGELNPSTVLNFLDVHKPKDATKETSEAEVNRTATKPKSRTVHESGVVVEGADNLMIRLSRCCNPVPGDEIIGYITRGRGISVHRKDCPNLKGESDLQNRTIDVHWDTMDTIEKDFVCEIRIIGFERSGLINDILHVVNHSVENLLSVQGKQDENSGALVTVKVGVSDTQQIDQLLTKLKSIPDVEDAFRKVS